MVITTCANTYREKFLTAFRKAHSERPIDLVWLPMVGAHCTPETLNEIRHAGVPVAVLNTDDKTPLPGESKASHWRGGCPFNEQP